MVQGWLGLFLIKKECTCPSCQTSLLFKLFHLYSNTIFPLSWKVMMSAALKVLCWLYTQFRTLVWVHHQLEVSLLGARSLFQTNESHWGLSQRCKEDGSWFCRPLLPVSPSSNSLFVDKHRHAVGRSSSTVPRFFLLNHLVRLIVKQVSVILCTNCYTVWKKNQH